jgi:radical SAM protein with 4Fe4S-binding SPASM domain
MLKDRRFSISLFDEPQDCAWWGCRAAKGSVAVTASGEIISCSAFVGSSCHDDYVIGTVFDGLVRAERRAEWNLLASQRGTKCNDCGLSGVCSGGCPLGYERASGNVVEPDPLTCWTTEMTLHLRKDHVERTEGRNRVLGTKRQLPLDIARVNVHRKPKIRFRRRKRPEVSVILPTYNQGLYIERAIRGLFRVGEWASVIRGFEASRGRFIAYLHSGDRWYPNHLYVLHEYLTAHPEKAIAYTSFHSSVRYAKHLDVEVPADDGWEWIPADQDLSGREKEILEKATWTFMVPPQVMHRRDCLAKYPPPTRTDDEAMGEPHVNPDGRLWQRFLTEYDIGFVDVPPLEWVIHGENQHIHDAKAGILPSPRSGRMPIVG